MTSIKPTHAYIGIKGGIVKAMMRDQADKDTAKEIAKWIRSGCSIERVPLEIARSGIFGEPWPHTAPNAVFEENGDG